MQFEWFSYAGWAALFIRLVMAGVNSPSEAIAYCVLGIILCLPSRANKKQLNEELRLLKESIAQKEQEQKQEFLLVNERLKECISKTNAVALSLGFGA